MSYEVLVLSQQLSHLGEHVVNFFKADSVTSSEQALAKIQEKVYRVMVWDTINESQFDLNQCKALLANDALKKIPAVLLTTSFDIQDKVKAFDIGCDDLIGSGTSPDDTCARITKSIFHQIANTQLDQRLVQATEAARNAMVDNSDLGANIQFLLQVHCCDNLDQLGQRFFATIERYGMNCSLQMRSEMGIKDMEAHGMAKDLESQLLLQLKDSGRYVDFGRRTVVNFDRVSLLIKNMPVDDKDKYSAIKDNTFCLVQGVNSRILALEDRFKLLTEKDSLRKLSSDVHAVINALQNSYQDVMKNIVNEVENATEKIQHRLPHLALMEHDEEFIDQITEGLVSKTNRIFNDGLKVDELFMRLEGAVERSLESVRASSVAVPKDPPAGQENVVELF